MPHYEADGRRCSRMSVVFCPAMPTPAFPDDHTPMATRELDVDGQKRSYFDQLAWAGPATLNGLLVTTAPIRRTDTGLPIGVPIIDGFLDDRTTIACAGVVEREFGGFTPPRCCNRPTRRRPGTTAAAACVDWTGARCSAAGERWTYCVSSAPRRSGASDLDGAVHHYPISQSLDQLADTPARSIFGTTLVDRYSHLSLREITGSARPAADPQPSRWEPLFHAPNRTRCRCPGTFA
jgi:hypothetical protein